MKENFESFRDIFGEEEVKKTKIEDVRVRIQHDAGEDDPTASKKKIYSQAIEACKAWLTELEEKDYVDPELLEAILAVKDEYVELFENETTES